MENGFILCKFALKNFGNVFLLTASFSLQDIHFSVKNFVPVFRETGSIDKKKTLTCFLSYKIPVYHKILRCDFVPRMNYCERSLHNINDDILDVTFFTDEVWFHLEGYVNSQNMRTWRILMCILKPLHA
ncbi:hypothetical protein BDFB_002352, partial [Asbolus verrucosus]